jgi:hypothetical protein
MLGIHIQTLVKLKRSPEFKSMLAKHIRLKNTYELPAIAHDVVSCALKGNMRAIKIYHRVVGLT